MELFKQKELHSIVFGLRVHKPDRDESLCIVVATLFAMLILNMAFPMPITWFFVGVVIMTSASLDLISPQNKISSFLSGLIIGLSVAQLNFLILG